MQLPLNIFHGYVFLKVGIHLGRYLRQCSLAFSGDYPLQHPSITIFPLRISPSVVLRKRHLSQ
ncbi:hypothetical protein NPIL_529701, partial [Nephila pilipes]